MREIKVIEDPVVAYKVVKDHLVVAERQMVDQRYTDEIPLARKLTNSKYYGLALPASDQLVVVQDSAMHNALLEGHKARLSRGGVNPVQMMDDLEQMEDLADATISLDDKQALRLNWAWRNSVNGEGSVLRLRCEGVPAGSVPAYIWVWSLARARSNFVADMKEITGRVAQNV